MVKYKKKYSGGNKEECECETKTRCCPCLDEEVDRMKQLEKTMEIADDLFGDPTNKQSEISKEEEMFRGMLDETQKEKRKELEEKAAKQKEIMEQQEKNKEENKEKLKSNKNNKSSKTD